MNDLEYALKLKEGLLVSHFLIHSFLYYKKNEPVIDDLAFDIICSRLLKAYPKINHRHKKLVKIGMLLSNSGFNLLYPKIVITSANQILTDPLWKEKDLYE